MAYTPRDWTDVPLNETPPDGAPALDAANLSHIEGGISAVHSEIDGRLSEASLSGTYVSSADYPGITVDTSVGTRVMVGGVRVYGDTGWRDITALMHPDYLAANPNASALLRRVGSEVTLSLRQRSDATASGVVGVTYLPTGFRVLADRRTWGATVLDEASGRTVTDGASLYLGSSGGIVQSFAVAERRYSFTIRFYTDDAWPATLPGTPG